MEINDYSGLFNRELIRVWHKLAHIVRDISGDLIGGTALATYLRHRISYDLDYMTYEPFGGIKLFEACGKVAPQVVPLDPGPNKCNLLVDDVKIDIFQFPHRGANPGYRKQLADSKVIDDLNVASLPDLFAMKLDIIMYRRRLRDYLDIMMIDQSGLFTIEDGIVMHAERYGSLVPASSGKQIIASLLDTERFVTDNIFGHLNSEVFDYFEKRLPALNHFLETLGDSPEDDTQRIPSDRIDTHQLSGYDPESLRYKIVKALRANRKTPYAHIARSLQCSGQYVSKVAREERLERHRPK